METLAVNLFDITDESRVPPLIRDMLLGGKLGTEAIWVDRKVFDEAAVELTCDLLTAACVCDTLRQHDRAAKQHPTRVYVRRAVAWSKVPGEARLTLVRGDRLLLNPAVFEPAESAGKVVVAGSRKLL